VGTFGAALHTFDRNNLGKLGALLIAIAASDSKPVDIWLLAHEPSRGAS
jgi:hypothetical protein